MKGHLENKVNESKVIRLLSGIFKSLNKPLAKYNWQVDIVVKDDPNKSVSGKSINIHNQGSTVVWVNETRLNPDDQLIMTAEADGYYPDVRLRIRFEGEYPFKTALADFPQLIEGNRLVINEQINVNIIKGKEWRKALGPIADLWPNINH